MQVHGLRLMRRAVPIFVAASLLNACGYMWGIEHAPLLDGPGPHSKWMRVAPGGESYDVDLHLPPRRFLSSGEIPLVIVLHGSGGTGPGMERRTRFSEIADSVGFAVAYPESHRNAEHRRLWGTRESAASDVAMLHALVDSVAARVHIDRKRVYLAGFSNGGGMTYRAARALPNLFAAIAVVAGTLDGESTLGEVRPTPLIAVHGMQDHTVPFDGEGRRPSAPAAVRAWAERNRCVLSPVVDTIPSINFIRTAYIACPNSADVVLYAAENGGHGWPNAGTNEAPLTTSLTIWEFFARHAPH